MTTKPFEELRQEQSRGMRIRIWVEVQKLRFRSALAYRLSRLTETVCPHAFCALVEVGEAEVLAMCTTCHHVLDEEEQN